MGDIYIGNGGIARKADNIYIGVNGIARQAQKIYIGVNGIAREAYSAFTPIQPQPRISVGNAGGVNDTRTYPWGRIQETASGVEYTTYYRYTQVGLSVNINADYVQTLIDNGYNYANISFSVERENIQYVETPAWEFYANGVVSSEEETAEVQKALVAGSGLNCQTNWTSEMIISEGLLTLGLSITFSKQ